jgi:hypothetical protein
MDDIQSGMIKTVMALCIFISAVTFFFAAERMMERREKTVNMLYYERTLYV